MNSSLLNLLARESVKVAELEVIYARDGDSPRFTADAIWAMRQLDSDLAWRAVWLLKRFALEHTLTEAELIGVASCLEEMPHWASRLNLCQLLAATGCPASAREALFPYLVECFANRRPMIRAWAISVLVGFRTDERYRKRVNAMLREAQADSAGSMQARLRSLGLKQPHKPHGRRASLRPRGGTSLRPSSRLRQGDGGQIGTHGSKKTASSFAQALRRTGCPSAHTAHH